MEIQFKQSRLMGNLEVAVSILVGFVVTMAIQLFMMPMFGIQIFMSEVIVISAILVLAAILKNVVIRWVFNVWGQRV